VTLRFPYLEELLKGPPPPSMPASATGRWRPLVPVVLHSPTGGFFQFARALVDSGADDTIFPLRMISHLGLPLLVDTRHGIRWQGQVVASRYALVELELADATGNSLRWPATVAVTSGNLPYPLLGVSGCLEFMDAKFLGKDRLLELEPNADFP
jgi:aspartyl protease